MKEKKSIQKTSVTFWESKIKIFEFLGEEAYDIQIDVDDIFSTM